MFGHGGRRACPQLCLVKECAVQVTACEIGLIDIHIQQPNDRESPACKAHVPPLRYMAAYPCKVLRVLRSHLG
eukprot:scaffold72023_cov31-Tisochrysis_lutea.AAC.1